MKRSGRTIRRRLQGVAFAATRLSRARHFRGHGVHSPFVYAIVRQVFMKRTLQGMERGLYEELIGHGLSDRRAVQLQNLCTHCGYTTFAIDGTERVALNILTAELPEEETLARVADAVAWGGTLCLLKPYASRERLELCRRIVEGHPSTSVDNRGYLLLFNEKDKLPKQHFRL